MDKSKLVVWKILAPVLALSCALGTAVVAPTATAAGTTYYVSRSGNNADGRSWATAWNELNQIEWSVIQPGDTILLDGGAEACQPIGVDFNSGQSCGMVYNTTLSVHASGVQGQPITIGLAPEAGRNGTVVIDGGVVGAKACPGYPGGYFPDYAVPSTPGNIDPSRPNSAGINLGSFQWIVVDGTKWGGIEIRNHSGVGLDFDHASNSTVRYLKIHHNRGIDFAAGAEMDWDADEVSGNTISHSEIFRNGQDGLHAKGDNFTLEYSYVHDHYCYHPDGIQGYHTQAVGDEAKALSGMVIRYNIFVNHGNLVENAGWHGQGIFIGNHGEHDSWGENVLIHDNLIVGVRSSAIISFNSRSTNFDVHHNTFVSIGGFAVNWNGSAIAPMSVQDNVFYDIGGGANPRLGFYLATTGGKTTFADNCVYLAGPISGNFDEWGTINRDPLFVDIANGDYALHSNSPCLGKGSSITSVEQLFGQPVPTRTPPPPTPTPVNTPTPTPIPVHDLSWEAEDGVISNPFTVSNTDANPVYVYQSSGTLDPAQGGRASYRFNIVTAGRYLVRAVVRAPDVGSNSVFINIDGEPQSPAMIWDIPPTNDFEERIVSWRGGGTHDAPEFAPKIFTLPAGQHEMIIRGREAYTRLDRISMELWSPGALWTVYLPLVGR